MVRSDLADVPAHVLQRTGGRGADLVLEAVGIARTVQAAIASVRKGGQVTLVGNLAPSVELPLQAIVTRELTLRGSCACCGEYPTCLEMLVEGVVQVEPLLSATAPLVEGCKLVPTSSAARAETVESNPRTVNGSKYLQRNYSDEPERQDRPDHRRRQRDWTGRGPGLPQRAAV